MEDDDFHEGEPEQRGSKAVEKSKQHEESKPRFIPSHAPPPHPSSFEHAKPKKQKHGQFKHEGEKFEHTEVTFAKRAAPVARKFGSSAWHAARKFEGYESSRKPRHASKRRPYRRTRRRQYLTPAGQRVRVRTKSGKIVTGFVMIPKRYKYSGYRRV
jgi:hypothetical protein